MGSQGGVELFAVYGRDIYFESGAVGVACCDYHVHCGHFRVQFVGGDD